MPMIGQVPFSLSYARQMAVGQPALLSDATGPFAPDHCPCSEMRPVQHGKVARPTAHWAGGL